jgi:hypothetical protein
MKTILCPVDFSTASYEISRFASHLAADVQAKVVIVATHTGKTNVLAGEGSKKDHNRLGELHDLISGSYHVPCSVCEEDISENVYKKLSMVADRYDLVVMDMKPAVQNASPNEGGLDQIKVIHETLVPVLFIPGKTEYKKINRLLYAHDPKHEQQLPLVTLHWLADWFEAETKIISILPSNISLTEKNRLISENKTVMGQWNSSRKLTTEVMVDDDVPGCLEHYRTRWNENDLLVLSVNHHTIFERIWHKSIVQRLLKNATHPYMIIHR